MNRKMSIEVQLDMNDVVGSLRKAAVAFISTAEEMEEEIDRNTWKPIETALKNGKAILARVVGGDYDPFVIRYDKKFDEWREVAHDIAIDPFAFIGPLEWKPLS